MNNRQGGTQYSATGHQNPMAQKQNTISMKKENIPHMPLTNNAHIKSNALSFEAGPASWSSPAKTVYLVNPQFIKDEFNRRCILAFVDTVQNPISNFRMTFAPDISCQTF